MGPTDFTGWAKRSVPVSPPRGAGFRLALMNQALHEHTGRARSIPEGTYRIVNSRSMKVRPSAAHCTR